jgi:4-hydroxythreonine-4-phosphate dehydrogenase
VLLTDHVALEGVVPLVRSFYLNPSAYSDAFIQVLKTTLRKQKPESKLRLVLLGLNPHASEQGLLGQEDLVSFQQPLLDWIKHCAQKAVEQERGLRQNSHIQTVELIGPISADSSARYFQESCLIISPYHDQGLSLLKSIFGHDALHQTFGLEWKGVPFRRYSVDHGTADDIAHQGKAKYHSLLFAWDFLKKLKK